MKDQSFWALIHTNTFGITFERNHKTYSQLFKEQSIPWSVFFSVALTCSKSG